MQENKKLIYAIFIAVIVVCGIAYVFITRSSGNQEMSLPQAEDDEVTSSTTTETINTSVIYVQVSGAVVQEGVFAVPEGTRVYEIIKLAGGLTEVAATEVVNQAREAVDGEMIVIPTIEAVENGTYMPEVSEALIHINTATKEQLMTLPGIGEAKALSIITFREENKGFKALEEIMEVDGIKEAMFNKIKDLITL